MRVCRILLCVIFLSAPVAVHAQEPAGEYTQVPPEPEPPTTDMTAVKRTADDQRAEHAHEIEKMHIEFSEKRRQDTLAFRDKLKSTAPEDRPAAIRAQNAIFHAEKLALNERIHLANKDFLMRRLDENASLPEKDRRLVLSAYENDYLSTASLSEAHHTTDLMKLEEIAATPGLSLNEILERYKEYTVDSRKPLKAAPRERSRAGRRLLRPSTGAAGGR